VGVGGVGSSTVASVGADVIPAGGVRSWAFPRERSAAQIASRGGGVRPAGRGGSRRSRGNARRHGSVLVAATSVGEDVTPAGGA